MALPKQVQQDIDDLEAYEAQLAAQPAQTAPEESELKVESTEQPSAEAPSNVVELQPAESVPRDETHEEPWEDRYRHLRGKYDAEVPRLHAELRELRNEIEALRQKATLPEPEPAPEPERYVTDQDVDAFGEDLIDLQRRVAREVGREFKAELTKLQQENQMLRDQVGAVQYGSFEMRLRQAVPDFDQVNTSREWVEWLNTNDPMLRGPRRAVAEAAYSRGDVEAVKAYVDLFKQTLPAARPDRQMELKRQVQPTKTAAQGAPVGQAKMYSGDEATAVFNKIQKLIAQGRVEEAQALETEISTAYVEGRVSA
jgi:hypothetical protein